MCRRVGHGIHLKFNDLTVIVAFASCLLACWLLLVVCWLYACRATNNNNNNTNNIEAILKFIKNDLRKTQFYFFIATK